MKFNNLKHKGLLCLLIFSLMAGLPSCVYDYYEDMEDTDIFEQGEPVGYMTVMLDMTAGSSTRAELGNEFEDGIAGEYELAPGQHHFALLYKEDTAWPVGIVVLHELTEFNGSKNKQYTKTIGAFFGNKTLLKDDISKTELEAKLEQINECLVLLNTKYSFNDLSEIKKEELLNRQVGSNFIEDEELGVRYFTMSNAVYADNNVKKLSTSINPKAIFQTREEAINNAAAGVAAIEASVERLAAKFSLSFDKSEYNEKDAERIFSPDNEAEEISLFSHLDENGLPQFHKGCYSYKVKITGWGMNALQKNIFLFKKITPDKDYFKGWNSTDYQRSYWAEDPDYEDNVKYPLQYRNSINSSLDSYFNLGNNNRLQNYSYEDIINQKNFINAPVYTPENTYDFNSEKLLAALDGRRDYLAGTHLLLTAELLTNFPDETEKHFDDGHSTEDYTVKDLYRDKDGNFYLTKKEALMALAAQLNFNLNDQGRMKFHSYDWTNGGKDEMLEASTQGEYALFYEDIPLVNYFSDPNFKPDDFTCVANVNRGDGQILFWREGLTVKKNENGTWKEIEIITDIKTDDSGNEIHTTRSASHDEIRSFIYEFTRGIDHFNEGRMYYAVPVELSKQDKDGNEIYGVVRNLSYSFLVKGINIIGIPVDNPEEEIIPNIPPDHYYIAVDLNVLPWKNRDIEVNW